MCPLWPGKPMTAHWGIPDPAAVEGAPQEQERAFALAFRELSARIGIFTSLRIDALDELALQHALNAIGKMRAEDVATRS
jgi:arsenate reductase